jgi:hypothetical protein
VAHDGGSGDGEFCQTLVLTCVATGWTEMRALRDKAQRWSFAAIVDIDATMPFPLLGLDSDNGSEFINDQLYRWCQANEVTFTRSRPYRKNDSCFVEQKNFLWLPQAVRELLPAPDETRVQDPPGRQGHPSLRHATTPYRRAWPPARSTPRPGRPSRRPTSGSTRSR